MNQLANKVAVFDIDGTLIDGNIQQGLINFFYHKKLLSLGYVIRLNLWFVLYKIGVVSDVKKIFEYGLTYLNGKSVSEIEPLVHEYASSCILNKMLPKSRTLVAKMQSEGYSVVLLSTAIDVIASEVSKIFGADDYICTRLEVIDGKYTGKIQGSICYGENKKIDLKNYFDSRAIMSDNVLAYADHESDISMLKSVGKGYVVNPNTHMRHIAAREGLDIIETR